MTVGSDAPAGTPSRPQADSVAAPRSWPWRRTALLLAGAAQLITISALVGSALGSRPAAQAAP